MCHTLEEWREVTEAAQAQVFLVGDVDFVSEVQFYEEEGVCMQILVQAKHIF